MSRISKRLIRVFLAAALVFCGVVTHMGSVAHAAELGFAHEHMSHAEVTPGSDDLQDSDKDEPGHALGLCMDAHCCTPAVQMASQDTLLHPLTSGKLAAAVPSNYALAVALSLLKPPRAIA